MQQRNGEMPLRGIHINISSDPFQHRIPPYLQRAWQGSRISHLETWIRKRYQRATPLELLMGTIVIFMGGIYLLVHVGFFSGRKYQDWRHDHDGRWLENIEFLDMLYPDDGLGLTTAVLVFDPTDPWVAGEESKKQLAPIIQDLCSNQMFKTILVWNNNPMANMTHEELFLDKCAPQKVVIHNSHSHMGQAARYLGCSLASTPYCYFQDHHGPRHWRSLYANFLKYPHLIHTETRDVAAYAQSRWGWCFFNDEIHMHTCHTHPSYGMFVSKENVDRFIQLLELDPIDITQSDMYFFTFMNQVPYQLEGTAGNVFPPFNDEEDRVGDLVENPNNPNLTAAGRDHVHRSVVTLYQHMSRRTGVFPTEEVFPGFHEQVARSPCHSDRCLFLTNVAMFPDPKLFKYEPSVTLLDSERMHNEYYDANSHYYAYPYGYAVDGNDITSWRSQTPIKAGDFIGLDLLMPMRIPLKFRILAGHPDEYREKMIIQISFDGQHWTKIQPRSEVDCSSVVADTMFECRFTIAETGYRFVRLQSPEDFDFPFDIYDFSFSVRVYRGDNGQLLVDEEGMIDGKI
ncbi:hypothetical protein BX666DRAFT_2029967 [Dichotomocladium elegans]|nr:hypothetical protein BX666DRAFT_2029967 [Dichotomocladium elegans]